MPGGWRKRKKEKKKKTKETRGDDREGARTFKPPRAANHGHHSPFGESHGRRSAGGAPRSAELFRGPGAVAVDGRERALAARNRRREVCLPADTGARKSAAIGAQANGSNLFRRLDRAGGRGFVVESQAQTGRTGSALGADRTGAEGRSLMNHWQLPIELTLKGIMILAAAGLLSVGLRNASAASRHAVWSLALSALLLLPALTWAVPAWRVAILPAPAPENA